MVTTILIGIVIGVALFFGTFALLAAGMELVDVLQLYGGIFSLILLIKVWIACGHIKDIRNQVEADQTGARLEDIRKLLAEINERGKRGEAGN